MIFGLFSKAHTGTVVFQEISDISPYLQPLRNAADILRLRALGIPNGTQLKKYAAKGAMNIEALCYL